MLPALVFATAELASSGTPQGCTDALITKAQAIALENSQDAGKPGSDLLHGQLAISEKVILKYVFSITSKGNGVIEFPKISIRIYDAHNDDITFNPYLLCVQIRDVNGDGYKDLVLTGTADHWDDEIDDKLLSSNPISAVFLYDPKKNTFVAQKVSDEIDYWYGKTYCEGMKCETE